MTASASSRPRPQRRAAARPKPPADTTARPHVASVPLPAGVAAEAIWDPLSNQVGLEPPAQRWQLRWTNKAPILLRPDPVVRGPVCSIGLNPSGAGVARGDMTLNTEWALYQRWGVEELLKLNLFPTIATYPADLLRDAGPDAYLDYVIAQAVACHRAGGIVIATWGGPYPGALRALVAQRADAVERGLRAARVPIHVLGVTKGGCPRHIRGIGRDARPQLWRAA